MTLALILSNRPKLTHPNGFGPLLRQLPYYSSERAQCRRFLQGTKSKGYFLHAIKQRGLLGSQTAALFLLRRGAAPRLAFTLHAEGPYQGCPLPHPTAEIRWAFPANGDGIEGQSVRWLQVRAV